ncbi:MAG TPA: LamG-like jellyroll fold domain-containing protein [Verrucomicrobiae bacterium]|nr:LamG-like jellyroll fold domain-containing protein [Verrucomicrobiae bacterium]
MKTQSSILSTNHKIFFIVSLLTMATVISRADYQSTILGDNPLAYYALNPAADGTSVAPDLTGNGNDGLAVNIAAATGPSSYIPNAANFNGQTAAIDLSQGSNPDLLNFLGPITLEVWAQPSSTSLFGDVVAKGYDSQSYAEIVIRVNGPYGANYYGSSGSVGVNGGTQSTNWTYIVLSSDGTNCSLYENGILVAQSPDTSGSTTNFPADNDDWLIGNGSSSGNGRLFNGNISEVAIYQHGLTAAQVLNHYFVGLVGIPAASARPIINVQPQSQPSYVGGMVTFSVTAVSALPMTNQWYFGSTPLLGQTNATLTLSNLQLTDAGNYSVVIGNANGTTNSVVAVLTVSTPRNLEWSANENNGAWDNSTPNWINLANSQPTAFNSGDAVLFDDTPGVPTTVAVSNTVFSSVVNVNASINSYTLNGPSNIGGYGSFIKNGSSTLNIFTPSGFAGTVAINGGTVYAGNNCFGAVSSITISNNATMDLGGGQFNNFTPISVAGNGSSGQGALINSYANYPSESVNITMTGDTTFAGSARWDLNTGSQINGMHNLTVDWSGAGGYGQWNGVSIGANVPQITVTNASTLGLTSMDSSCQNPATLFNISTNGQLVLYSGGFNGSVNLYNGANMIVYSGNVNLAGSILHIYSGATMYLYAQGIAMTGNNLIFEDGASLQTYYNSGNNPINNQVTFNGVAHLVLGDHSESFNNVMSGAGGFVLDYYNNSAVLSASNTYSGPTIIGDGPQVALTGNGSISQSSLIFFGGSNPNSTHIDLSGRSDQTLTLASGQTLGGVGAINGSLVVSSGATISPAGTNTTIGITTGSNPVGTLAAANNVTLNGTTVIKLGSGTNDIIQAGGNITYGGTLNLVNISGTSLAAGNSFQIFNAANRLGSFASISPTTPGSGLAWDTNQLSSGIVNVVASSSKPVVNNIQIVNNSLILSGSGGTANGAFSVVTSTNLATPLTNWISVLTTNFDSSGNFNVTNSITPGVSQQFYSIKQ